jgi:glycosyltransferase involved in cell wall biosynthesis
MGPVFNARPPDVALTPYTSALLSGFDNYLTKVDPSLGALQILTSGEPDYATLTPAALVVALGTPSAKTVRRLEKRAGLHRAFSGALATAREGSDVVPFTLFDRWDVSAVAPRPSTFDVLVVVTTFNEADVIEQLLERLTTGAIRVHVVDNWSTDTTPEILDKFAARGRVTWERFPAAGSSGHFELERLLRRVEEVAADSGADWVIHHDADEIRESPWPGVSLIDALWAVEQWGYNCIDHTVINFRPVDNSWSPGDDLATSFPWCEFGDTPADFLQIKGWKPQATRLSMASNAGHEVKFEGRRVFPYKFLLRHYSIRSQEHGERKILRERQPRWSPEERAKGWHVHYDHYDEQTSFLWKKEGLLRWGTIDEHFLLGRLSGVGMANNPWLGEGPVVDA